MYPIHPEKVYVLDRVYQNPLATVRLERMLAKIQPKEIIRLTDTTLHQLVVDKEWTEGHQHRTGYYRRQGPPTLIFNTFRWNNLKQLLHQICYPVLNHAMLLGNNPITFRKDINHLERNVCQAAYELHSIFGCLHACDYCHVEDFVNIMLNIEDLIDHLKTVIPKHPDQFLYKYDNWSDICAFEPEYNATEPLVRYFATLSKQYLLLYTKSANIDFLLNLPHNGHTLINWSLSPPTQSALIEKETPHMNQRIKAMEKCQNAGYTVRVRFSPMIPVKNWQEEINTMVTKLLSKVHPDVITLDIIGFMTPQVMREVIDQDLFDPDALRVLEDVEKTTRMFGKHVFPHDFRLNLYRHIFGAIRSIDPHVPISICNETTKMWDDLKLELGEMTPQNYACCCGPTSVPGHPFLNGMQKERIKIL
jgi:DNA repair photolyase